MRIIIIGSEEIHSQCEEKCKRHVIVTICIVNDCGRNKGTYEGRGFSDLKDEKH